MTTPIDNGSILEKYSWTQTAYDLTIIVSLNDDISSKDEIKVDVTNQEVNIYIKEEKYLENNTLSFDVIVEKTFWYKDDKNLIIELEKAKKHEWWRSVFIGDEEIDTSKVVPPTESVNDLDSETRATIDKMLYDQRKKEEAGYYNKS